MIEFNIFVFPSIPTVLSSVKSRDRLTATKMPWIIKPSNQRESNVIRIVRRGPQEFKEDELSILPTRNYRLREFLRAYALCCRALTINASCTRQNKNASVFTPQQLHKATHTRLANIICAYLPRAQPSACKHTHTQTLSGPGALLDNCSTHDTSNDSHVRTHAHAHSNCVTHLNGVDGINAGSTIIGADVDSFIHPFIHPLRW